MFCATDPAAWGNWSGLVGTFTLGLGTFLAFPIAARAYRVSKALLEMNEKRRQQAEQPAEEIDADLKGVDQVKLQATLQRLKQHDEALHAGLNEAEQQLSVQQGQWNRINLWIFVVGFVLTLASDGLPLFLPKCVTNTMSSAVHQPPK